MKKQPLTPAEYHALGFDINKLPNLKEAGHLSASKISEARDPLKMVWCKKDYTDSMSWGSLIDCLWTTPSLFASQYHLVPEDAPNDVRDDSRIMNAKKPSDESLAKIAWWNNFDKELAGRTPIKASDLSKAKSAIRMLNENALSHALLKDSETQVALVGDSPIHDGRAKGLIDLLPHSGPFVDAIVDLKTTSPMGEWALYSTSKKFDYAVKLAWYGALAEAAGLGFRPRGVLIWQDSKFPYEVKVREIPKHAMAEAREALHDRITILESIHPADMRPHFDVHLKEMVWPSTGFETTEEE